MVLCFSFICSQHFRKKMKKRIDQRRKHLLDKQTNPEAAMPVKVKPMFFSQEAHDEKVAKKCAATLLVKKERAAKARKDKKNSQLAIENPNNNQESPEKEEDDEDEDEDSSSEEEPSPKPAASRAKKKKEEGKGGTGASTGKGKGKGTGSSTGKGKGKGTGSATEGPPEPTASPRPAEKEKGKGKEGTGASTGKGKGKGTGSSAVFDILPDKCSTYFDILPGRVKVGTKCWLRENGKKPRFTAGTITGSRVRTTDEGQQVIEYQGKWDDGYDDKAEDIWNTIGHAIQDIVFQPPPKDITFKDGMLHVPENKLASKKRPAAAPKKPKTPKKRSRRQ